MNLNTGSDAHSSRSSYSLSNFENDTLATNLIRRLAEDVAACKNFIEGLESRAKTLNSIAPPPVCHTPPEVAVKVEHSEGKQLNRNKKPCTACKAIKQKCTPVVIPGVTSQPLCERCKSRGLVHCDVGQSPNEPSPSSFTFVPSSYNEPAPHRSLSSISQLAGPSAQFPTNAHAIGYIPGTLDPNNTLPVNGANGFMLGNSSPVNSCCFQPMGAGNARNRSAEAPWWSA